MLDIGHIQHAVSGLHKGTQLKPLPITCTVLAAT